MKELILDQSDINKMTQIPVVGNEARLYVKDNTVYKIYLKSSSKNRLNRLREKLVSMSSNTKVTNIPNFNWPQATIMIDGEFRGITQPYLKDYYNLCDMKSNDKNLIPIIKQLSHSLQLLHEHEISFGDMNAKNIMVNGKDSKFVDVDGIRYKDHDCYSYSTYLNNYNIEGPSPFSDNFALAYLALNTITDCYIASYRYSSFYDKFMSIYFPKELGFFENILVDFDDLYLEDYIDVLEGYKYNCKKKEFIKKNTK